MSCMYGHIQPLQRAVYREFYYISLIKTVSIHLLDNPVCTFLVVYTNLQGFNEFGINYQFQWLNNFYILIFIYEVYTKSTLF